MGFTISAKKQILGLAAAGLMSLTLAAPALAADDTNITVTGGDLSITADPTVPDFTGITLDGTAQTDTTTLAAFEVNDARGTGVGWHVNVQASQFAEHNGTSYVASGKTLATGSLTMSAPTLAADGTSSTVPTVTSGPYTIDVASPVEIASAAADAGMGKYDFSSTTFTLSVPASAFAKTYRSNVTVDVVTGP